VATIGATRGLAEREAASPAAGARADVTAWSFPDRRRALQLSLAALWLLDGVLQLQPFMFTPAFGGQFLAAAAHRNPAPVAASIGWVAQQVAHHPGLANTLFAFCQIGIGLGIAWRRSLRAALAASVCWALAVWWFGEGLGGLLTGTASPLTGAPGAALLYALLAVLLWPAPEDVAATGSAVVRRPIGTAPAAALWVALWGSLAFLSLSPANRAADGLSRRVADAAAMAPGWVGRLDRSVAGVLAGHGLEAAVVLAVLFSLVALAALVPPAIARPLLVLTMGAALAIWIVGQSFGGVMMGQGTDPNSGPLLVLLAAAYWPARRVRRAAAPTAGST
jgi:hypothetical protein